MKTQLRIVSGMRLLAMLLASMSGCSTNVDSDVEPTVGKPVVYAVNYPLKYFAERIAGDHVDVRFPVPRDVDPAFWKPDTDQIAAFQQADLILLNGASYAKWCDKVSLPESKTIDTSRGFRDRLIQTDAMITHSHGPDGDHSHSGTAFTTWLDFAQASQQAAAIKDALVGVSPEHAAIFESNNASLQADLAELDRSLHETAAAIGAQPLLASHPVYQYLARRYELNLQSVLWEPTIVPDAQAIAGLELLLASHPAQWMIWEAEPAAESVQLLESLGIRSVVYNPCGNVPDDGDFLSVMRSNIAAFKRICGDDAAR